MSYRIIGNTRAKFATMFILLGLIGILLFYSLSTVQAQGEATPTPTPTVTPAPSRHFTVTYTQTSYQWSLHRWADGGVACTLYLKRANLPRSVPGCSAGVRNL